MSTTNSKNEKLACAGAGGSLGLAAIAGACTTGCSFVAAPLAGLLSSVGLGSVAAFLPSLRIPLILSAFIAVNLIKHLLDVPYTKKDGTVVSLEDIRAMKTRSQEAYAEAVAKNAKAMASAGV